MPAALDVNWEAVKVHCVAHGIPDAAKRYGITQEAIRQRCHREGWKNNPAVAEALVRQGFMSRSVTSAQKAPGELMAESLKDKLLRTRANYAETALIASAEMLTLAETMPKALRDSDVASTILTHTKQAALVGGWNDQAPTAKINLTVTGAENPVTLEAEIVSQDPDIDILADY
jgi:hypothetical protein